MSRLVKTIMQKNFACTASGPFLTYIDYLMLNQTDILASRHYRKDEHIWYWTHEGLLTWIASALGRDVINSYAFRRGVHATTNA